MEDLSVAEAASALEVDESRIRQMLRSGALAGRHVGRAWVVSGEALADLHGQRSPAGRPLAAKRAWTLLDLLDGGRAAWLDPVARSQVRAHSAASPDQTRRDGVPPCGAGRSATLSSGIAPPSAGWLPLTTCGPPVRAWPQPPAPTFLRRAPRRSFTSLGKHGRPSRRQLHLSPAAGRAGALIRVPRDLWPFGRTARAAPPSPPAWSIAGSGRPHGPVPRSSTTWRHRSSGDVPNRPPAARRPSRRTVGGAHRARRAPESPLDTRRRPDGAPSRRRARHCPAPAQPGR